ncbi:MAG: PAS domain-containing sensor histidine kinase [Myxococcales bacterium]|nr:PAS domain-containing sensor histidine kinase [Myxococcales bacterium]
MRWRDRHEVRVVLLALAAGAPALIIALALLLLDDHSAKARWTLGAIAVVAWLGGAAALHARLTRSLHTVSALLAALREEDFSLRARVPEGDDDALAGVLREINGLADTLREQRLGAFEADALLRKVMEEIDVAVLAFDAQGILRLANHAATRLLGGASGLLGRDAASLGLAPCLEGDAPRTLLTVFPGGPGPWELRRGHFRQRGLPHTLVVLTDLRRALREEERQAWQRLVRVLGHEINNSLAPIQSIAEHLRELVGRPPAERAPDLDEDLVDGLEVITRRSAGLSRFLAAYARLARLPPPRFGPVDVSAWSARVAALERRVPVTVIPGPALTLQGDGDQLDQLLINLVRNAADAALLAGEGGVVITWRARAAALELTVIDEGPGLADTANLFVPFFTTKAEGTGIGLVLARQIAEAHGGALELVNRGDGERGCEARVRLGAARASGGSTRRPDPEVEDEAAQSAS